MNTLFLACPMNRRSFFCHEGQAKNAARCIFGMQWLMRTMSSDDDDILDSLPLARVEDRSVLGQTRRSWREAVDPCRVGQASTARQS